MCKMRWPWALWLVVACVCVDSARAQSAKDASGTLDRARRAAAAGRFSEAETLLGEKIADPHAPVVDEAAVQLEILRRIRLDFSLTAEEVLGQLRQSIPDLTAQEMEDWRRQGVLQHRIIDGETRYFDQAAGNLFRACPAAQARRRTRVAPAGARFDLPKHLAQLVAEADRTGQTQVHPVRHRVRYTLRVKEGKLSILDCLTPG